MPTDSALRLLLWIVALNTGLLVVLLWRRGLAGRQVFAGLLVADLLLSVVLLAAHRQDHPLAFVAIGAFVFLVIVPMPLRAWTALAARRGRFDLALRLTGLREMLQPGAGVGQEKELLRFLQRVHSGDTREVLGMLRAQADGAEAAGDAEQQAIAVEQLLTLLVIERRYEEAEQEARARVTPEMVAERPRLGAALIRVYGERGDLAEVVRTMSLVLGAAEPSDPEGREVVAHCQVMTLAFLGRPEMLEELFSEPASLSPVPKVQAFWMAVASQQAGEVEEARRWYDRAEALLEPGDRPALESIQERRASLTHPPALAAAADPEQAERLVGAIYTREVIVGSADGMRPGRLGPAPVTTVLLVINLLAFGWVWLGGPSDLVNRRLLLAGASLNSAVTAGELWRLVTASFLHAGWLHVGLNTLMLWFLGRFSERLIGSVRTLIVYVLGGVAGNLASHLWRSYPVSVGASSSLFALLGATMAVLLLSRGRAPERWRRQMLLLLAAVIALSFLPGLVDIKQIDNYAHLGGLAGGLVLGIVLLVSMGRPVLRWIGPALGIAAVGALVYGAVGVATSDLSRLAWTRSVSAGLSVSHPVSWYVEPGSRPGHVVLLNLLDADRVDLEHLVEVSPAPPAWQRARIQAWKKRGRQAKQGTVKVTPLRSAGLPRGFRGVRLDVERSGERFVVIEAFGASRRSRQGGGWRARLQTDAARLGQSLRVLGKILRRARAR